jgi:hypothetical protein
MKIGRYYLELAVQYHLAGETELEKAAYETYLMLNQQQEEIEKTKEKAAKHGRALTA